MSGRTDLKAKTPVHVISLKQDYLFDMSLENTEFYELVYRDGNKVIVVSNIEPSINGLEKALVFFADNEELADDIVDSLRKLAEAGRWFFVYDYEWLEWLIYCVYDIHGCYLYVDRS